VLQESTSDRDFTQLKSRNETLIFFRFIAGIILLFTSALFYFVDLGYSSFPIFFVGICVICYNSIFFVLNKNTTNTSRFSQFTFFQVFLDWLSLFFVAMFTGFVSSPSLFLFPLYAGMSGIMLSKKMTFYLTSIAIVLILLLGLLSIRATLPTLKDSVIIIGSSFFYGLVLVCASLLGLWASKELRERLEIAIILKEQFYKENDRLNTIYNVALSVNSQLEVYKVLRHLSDSLASISPVSACVIRLISDDRKTVSVLEASGVSAEYGKSHTVNLADDRIDVECLKAKLPIFVPNVLKDPRFLYKNEAKVEGLISMLAVPIIHLDEVLGVIRCYTKSYYEFTNDDVEFVALIASQAALSIVNAKAYEKVVELDKSRTSFIRVVTHELRAPMAAVQSILQIVLDGYTGEVSEKQRSLFERANDRVTGLLRLVSELLEFEGASAKDRDFEEIDLRKIMTDVVFELAPKADVKHIRIKFIPSGDNLKLIGWKDGIHRVFENFVDNAIKYTKPNGSVSVNMHFENGHVITNIIDNGIGIPKESIPRLFTEFYRAQNAKQEEVQGTGLGLAISKKIISIHNGDISVNSVLGSGTTFTILLPTGTNFF
jgi:signal transduction histidine kinase